MKYMQNHSRLQVGKSGHRNVKEFSHDQSIEAQTCTVHHQGPGL